MARENVESVRRMFDGLNANDIEGTLTELHPAVLFRTSGTFPGLKPEYRGHAGFRQFWQDFAGTWDSLAMTMVEVREIGPEQVVGLYTFEATARDGIKVGRPSANVFDYQDGLVTAIQAFGDWQEALEAVGLRE
jgi:ketosteroid isomerase-like protein